VGEGGGGKLMIDIDAQEEDESFNTEGEKR
jgi:hypothetical protein